MFLILTSAYKFYFAAELSSNMNLEHFDFSNNLLRENTHLHKIRKVISQLNEKKSQKPIYTNLKTITFIPLI